MTKHKPVLPYETIKYLAPQKNQNFIDATCGLGGHTKMILEKTAPQGRVLAIDEDAKTLEIAKVNLQKYHQRVDFVTSNFNNLGLIAPKWPVKAIHGILFDLGISSFQLEDAPRGFSFQKNGPLDMRLAQNTQLTAQKIVNNWSEHQLKQIFSQFGEEPFAGKIASEIVKCRRQKPITTTIELADIIKRATPPQYRFGLNKNYATRVFQALRIAVNDELNAIESALKQAIPILSSGGRIVIISFHSLEDRIVKNFFINNESLEILTSKPIVASAKEIQANPRSRSAKLRAAKKIN